MTSPDDFLERLWNERATAILRWHDQRVADEAMAAAIRGGFGIVEFTMTVPGVLELIAKHSKSGDVVVGAGTVLTLEQARDAVDAGARFLVSPIVDEAVIEEASRLGVAVMPGTHTPTEMWRAYRAGAPLQKLFPAAAAGPDTVRSILGPMPFLRIVPTNGVTEDNAAEYLRAGAYAVGMVRSLFSVEDMTLERYDVIEARARALRLALERVER